MPLIPLNLKFKTGDLIKFVDVNDPEDHEPVFVLVLGTTKWRSRLQVYQKYNLLFFGDAEPMEQDAPYIDRNYILIANG